MNKFVMELVWHNCLNCPPEEIKNDNLFVSNGTYVARVEYDRYDGYDRWWDAYLGDYIPSTDLHNYWWADLEQTVYNVPRFRLQK